MFPKMGAGIELAQLFQLPVVITPDAHPVCVITEASQVSVGDSLEQVSHIRHKPEWGQLFYVQPLFILSVLHGFNEPLDPQQPLLAFQRTTLSPPVAVNYVGEISPPPGCSVTRDVIQGILTGNASVTLSRSSGGGPISPI